MILNKKLKRCDGCLQLQPIWKRDKNKVYCKTCWNIHGPKKPKLKRVSKKQQKLNQEYSALRITFLQHPDNSQCRAKFAFCLNSIGLDLTIHHSKGRGKYLLDTSTWIPLCLNCHQYCEEHPEIARAFDFTKPRI